MALLKRLGMIESLTKSDSNMKMIKTEANWLRVINQLSKDITGKNEANATALRKISANLDRLQARYQATWENELCCPQGDEELQQEACRLVAARFLRSLEFVQSIEGVSALLPR